VTVTVNGSRREMPEGATVASVVAELDLSAGARGVAVAVNGEVVSRTRWSDTKLPPGARIEVLAAIQGG